jgi:N-formylglutamate amidohydrolase
MGAPLMRAEFPRAWLDLNREPYELDPEMFQDPSARPCQHQSSVRVAGGLGTIPRIVSEGEEIYAVKLDWKDAQARIQNHYVPYHEALRQLMADTYRQFRHRDPGGLPLHAFGRRPVRKRPARHRAGRPARHLL